MEAFTDGSVRLEYMTRGAGPAVLLLAPGGLRASRADAWDRAPWNPIDDLAGSYHVVAMDQRNTGTSFAPVTAEDDWSTYARDQIALLDHLGIERFSVLGMCIGGAFILRLLVAVPERVDAAVLLQPIGRKDNRVEFRAIFDQWCSERADEHPEADDLAWEGAWSNLFGGDDMMWSVPDDVLPTIDTPMLVLEGNDVYHPREASKHLASTAPNAHLVERWKDPADQPAARAAVHEFLEDNAVDQPV